MIKLLGVSVATFLALATTSTSGARACDEDCAYEAHEAAYERAYERESVREEREEAKTEREQLLEETRRQAQEQARRARDEWWQRVDIWILAYWMAFLVNATFDVFLEGPQGGIWFWSIFGFGIDNRIVFSSCCRKSDSLVIGTERTSAPAMIGP